MAFRSHPEVTIGRMGLAFAVAVTVGLLVYVFQGTTLKRSLQEFSEQDSAAGERKLHEHPKTWKPVCPRRRRIDQKWANTWFLAHS